MHTIYILPRRSDHQTAGGGLYRAFFSELGVKLEGRPMKRVCSQVLLAWMAAFGPCKAQTVVIGAGYAPPAAIDVAPGQLITIFARVPGKTPADPVVAK